MNQTDFEIKIIYQHWIKDDGQYDKEDLCSHGGVYVRIGTEELSNEQSGSWTLSVAGLYLLRSLEQDCELNQFDNQLIPCCGHFMIPDESGANYVFILGCPSGIDWKIKHTDGLVVFESKKGTKGELTFDAYKQQVMNFISEIETFYGDPKNKIVRDEAFHKNGFNQFWAEWNERKSKWE